MTSPIYTRTELEFVSPEKFCQLQEGCQIAEIELVYHEIHVDSNDVVMSVYQAIDEHLNWRLPVYACITDSKKQFWLPYWMVRLWYFLKRRAAPGKLIFEVVLMQTKSEDI